MIIRPFRLDNMRNVFVFVALTGLLTVPLYGDQPLTGPPTEQRFPPLILPAGFKATLFACDPLVEYPSVIALGPRPHSVFVAHDYLTGLGTEIVRRDEIRLVEDTDGDGYADKSTVFADGFNSIQGLSYHAGTVFAMHAPLLTALRDTDGDGAADERRDLLVGLGLPPEKNPGRLHCANGVVVGHDGWLCLALGDNGTDVQRPEGDRLVLNGGGILRCRPDGRGLHVFATGLRNIYDVALDDELNVFVRDNENDGGDYMIRVCHSFHGADHGYPYLYYERPDEALPPLADLGRGSSAGGVCYLETAFPPEFRGNLFFCEWGRSVVRYDRQRAHCSFAPMQEIEFAAGAATDPYGFKPTDVIADRDGSLLVSDWGDGQRPQRGRGRVYRISYVGQAEASKPPLPSGDGKAMDVLIVQLNSPSYHARVEAQTAIENAGAEGLNFLKHAIQQNKVGALGRLHAVWLLAQVEGRHGVDGLFTIAESDADPRVRAQAVRAIADLVDPVLTRQRLDAGRGDATLAARLAALAKNQNPRVVLEIVVALGRWHWADAPGWLRDNLMALDPAIAQAALQTLRRCDNWPAVLKLLDEPDQRPVRNVALRAVADRADTGVVDGLIERMPGESDPRRRQEYADALSRVYKKPGPWVYWGYRPPPRPANTVTWERSEAIAQALDRVLADPDRDVRTAILRRMHREQIPIGIATLSHWLRDERSADRVSAILQSLAKYPPDEVRELWERVIQEREYAADNRQRALAQFVVGLDESNERRLLELAARIEDGPVLVELLSALTQRPKIDSRQLLLRKLDSAAADVRAAAVAAVAGLKVGEAAGRVPALLTDPDVRVRRAAASAAGTLAVIESAAVLLELSRDSDPAIRSASLDSLRQLHEPTAVLPALATLNHPVTQLAALEYLAEFGGPEQVGAVTSTASNNRSTEILTSVVRALANWETKEHSESPQRLELKSAVARVQGDSGVLLRWQVLGPLSPTAAAPLLDNLSPPATSSGSRSVIAVGADSRVDVGSATSDQSGSVWLALSEVLIAEPTRVQFLASSSGTLQVWLNGRSVHQREKAGAFQPDSDRFEVQFDKGTNRVLVQVALANGTAQFHLRFRRLSSSAEQERLAQYALQNTGSADRGRELFLNAEKSLCLKCHRLDAQGGSIGPDLTGIGSRFSRVHLIESLLEPSRTIAPSYETIAVALTSGRVVTGVRVAEDDQRLILGDDQGKAHEIPQAEIDERRTQPRSTMPDGLEKRLTDREFLDLVTFLLARKKSEPR